MFRFTDASNVELEEHPFCYGRLIVVNGPLDTRSARSFLDVFERAIDQPTRAVVLDLCGTIRLDALGEAALVRATRRAARLGKTILIAGQSSVSDLGARLGCRILPSRRVAIAAAIASSVRP